MRARLQTVRRTRALQRLDARGIADVWSRELRPIPVPGLTVGADDPRLIVLPKLGGTEDVVATLAGRGPIGIQPVGLPRGEVKAVFRAVLGASADLLTDTDYRPGDAELVWRKAHYRALLTEVVGELERRIPVAGFVGANVAYYAERELAAACEEAGIPFVVLHKEAIRTPRQREFFTRAYRERIGAFGGRLVATYNEDERTSQVTAGAVAADRIVVVGSPRVDALHRLRRSRSSGRLASDATVLFAIDPAAGTWTPFDGVLKTGAPRWEELARRTEQAVAQLAIAHPARRFVVKVKLGREAATLARLSDVLPDGPPSNLEIVTGGTATELLAEASVIIGFNSTVLLEGLAAGVPVIMPGFAEAAADEARGWMLDLGDSVTVVPTPAALADAVSRAWDQGCVSDLVQSTRSAIERYLGDADGRASDRCFEALVTVLRSRR
jgi:hypothetical protein